MSESKLYLLSAGVCLACSALILVTFIYADKSAQIQALSVQAKKNVYLKNHEQMNEEMAFVMLPLLQKQHKLDAERSRTKKPDTVFVPEQLQNARGY